MPTISVIVPVYNVEPYLSRCVDSILSQTYSDFELILVDDGSPDNCPAICDEYAENDSRVRVIHQENGGLSAARNAGIDYVLNYATSEWITFIDSDDVVFSDYLETLLTSALYSEADISICGLSSFSDESSLARSSNFSGRIVLSPHEACLFIYTNPKRRAVYVSATCKLYRVHLFENIRFPVDRIHEDQFTTYKLLYSAEKLVEVGENLYGYYTRNDSIMNTRFSLKRYDNLVACSEAIDFFENQNEHDIAYNVGIKMQMIAAQYAIAAKHSGLSRKIPDEYHIPFYKAVNIIRKTCGDEYCEYFLNQYYPGAIKTYSYIKKIKTLLFKK